jgi:hypothetical protein
VVSNFNDFKSAEKAVHLLQYLASGKTESPEYELILNKILCDIDVHYPVNKNVMLQEFEKNEADDLIHSVIKNWNAIKNTSPDGFKEAFMKRAGILINEEDKWILKVERKTYDILLDKIPWSYSVIKLPWMKKILYVEW